jgi:hypothetical protein
MIFAPTEKIIAQRVIMIVPRILGWNSGAEMRLMLIYNIQINGKNAPGKNHDPCIFFEIQLVATNMDMQHIIVII